MDYLNQFLSDTALHYPILMTVFLVVGVMRSIFKPAMTLLHAYVMATPSKSDDESLANFEAGKIYKGIVWVVDYLASIKLPMPAAPKDVTPKP